MPSAHQSTAQPWPTGELGANSSEDYICRLDIPEFLMVSGARYSCDCVSKITHTYDQMVENTGVPHKVQVCPVDELLDLVWYIDLSRRSRGADARPESFFAKPKSTSLMWPWASRRMFSGFKSRYVTPSFSCRNSKMRHISAA